MLAALRPGGRLVAQCGGEGNIARFHALARAVASTGPWAEHLDGWRGPWNFAGPEETEERLRDAGFTEARAWLEPWPVRPDEPAAYLAVRLPRAVPRARSPRTCATASWRPSFARPASRWSSTTCA